MWKELLAVTKFITRWRVESTEQALHELAESERDKRMLRHLAAFELGTIHLQRSLLSMVISLAKALEELGVRRREAAVTLQLYLASVYTSLIQSAKSRLDMVLMASATLVITSATLGAVMSILAPEGVYMLALGMFGSLILAPMVSAYLPELGRYPLKWLALPVAGAAVGGILFGVRGYLIGIMAGSAPATYFWLKRWRKYEREVVRIDRVIETAREGLSTGSSVLGQHAREIYEHVNQVGAYDLEIQSRELLLYTARYFSELRAIGKERALALAVLMAASLAVVKVVAALVFSFQALQVNVQPPPGASVPTLKLTPPDLSMLGWLAPVPAVLIGRMFDSWAATAPFLIALSAVGLALVVF
jgi:hypothetical protein